MISFEIISQLKTISILDYNLTKARYILKCQSKNIAELKKILLEIKNAMVEQNRIQNYYNNDFIKGKIK
ncbi:MAG: hypothetical protein ACTSQA_00560 [Candidatus Heimdallarchaeaceae archaeon]